VGSREGLERLMRRIKKAEAMSKQPVSRSSGPRGTIRPARILNIDLPRIDHHKWLGS